VVNAEKGGGKDRKGEVFMKKSAILIVGFALLLACGLVLTGCPAEPDDDSPVWLQTNQKSYKVTDGVAGDLTSDLNITWIKHKDDKHWEYQNSGTMSGLSVSADASRDGNTMTLTIVISTAIGNATSTDVSVYDAESGLTLSAISDMSGVMTSHTETNYTIELLGTADKAKTYKRYDTKTGGTGSYYVYTILKGITLEEKYYNAGDVLNYTSTYTFPDNKIIRKKLPDFTIENRTYETPTATNYNRYQTCEVVSNSSSELIVSVKTYTTEGTLKEQSDTTYKPRSSLVK